MMYQITAWKSARIFLSSVLATLLLVGPVLFASAPGGEGMAMAGRFDKQGDRTQARPQKSRIDRTPRASSASQGSLKKASRERPATQQQAKSRPQLKPQAKATPQARPQQRASGSPGEQAFARKAEGKPQQKAPVSSRENLAARDQIKRKESAVPQARERAASRPDASRLNVGQDRQAQRMAQRTDRDRQVTEGRKQYAANKKDIRSERKKAAEELQQNKFDHRDQAREDRQDWADASREDRQEHQRNLANERRELYEDIYDDRRYWGNDDYYWDDDDDDDGWLWGIGGVVIGGIAGYAIGAAVNEPPEGTVAVPVGGVPYQYYGGAFYEPAPSGTGYVTTAAPVGAQVEAPPIDCTIVFGPEDEGYCYFQGAFFIYDESSDQYVVVEPPAGTSVAYLPPGYEEVTVADTEYMKLGGTYYRPYYENDEVIYVVSEV
jgi:hypothetical protein